MDTETKNINEMKATQIEKLNQLISRTDMTGNQKVEWLTNFIDEHVTKQLRLHNVNRSVPVYIKDRDIDTIEALHDLLLDAHGYSIDFIALKRARELTAKMYKAFD